MNLLYSRSEIRHQYLVEHVKFKNLRGEIKKPHSATENPIREGVAVFEAIGNPPMSTPTVKLTYTYVFEESSLLLSQF